MKFDKKIKMTSALLEKRRQRIRKKIQGTAERPRLSVRFTHRHIHAQFIDDVAERTLLGLSTNSKGLKSDVRPTLELARTFGDVLGKKAKDLGIDKVVFDRNGRRYQGQGKISTFADSVRKYLRF